MAQLTIPGLAVAVDFADVQHATLEWSDNSPDAYERNVSEGHYVMTLHTGSGDKHTCIFPTEADASRFMQSRKARFKRATIVWLGTKLQ